MHLNDAAPYISVVVAARNDNHGGNMLRRMQAFLTAWFGQAVRYDIPSEVIVVEWNPPADRPKLRECLELPSESGPCVLRFVEVSPQLHRTFPNPDAIPLHQMIAKNVGIRRARGRFILSTNLDIVFSAEFMRFVAERRLEHRTIYRMDRHDVSSEIPEKAALDELLAFCQRNMKRVFTAEGDFDLDSQGLRKLESEDIVAPEGIRLGPGWHKVERYENDPFRWIAEQSEIIFDKPRDPETSLLMEVEAGPSASGGVVTLEVVDRDGSPLASATVKGRSKLRLHIPARFASGSVLLRLRCTRLALARDSRFLILRVFRIWWEDSPWFPAPAAAALAKPVTEANVRVRSLEPRRIELALHPGEGTDLENLEFHLTDSSGNQLFRFVSEHVPTARNGEYLLAVNFGFKFIRQRESPQSVLDGSAEPGQERPRDVTGWFLEVINSRPGLRWATMNQAPSPFADQMHNPALLHTNGSGDFTLLSREDWWSLRGYAEFPIWPVHIDSLFCYSAHYAGIREVVLREPMRIFHIEHLSGAGWTPEGEEERVSRIESKGVSVLQHVDLVNWIDWMRRFHAPAIFTLDDWGLAGDDLPETSLQPHSSAK
jgi:hypothetical protein